MEGTNPSLVEELIYDVTNDMPVNKMEPNILKDNISNLCSLSELQQSETQTEGKEKEKLIDLEDGEISDSGSIKKNDNKICRFFRRGSCFYGSHCQFRHVSDKVYKMFDPIFSYQKGLKETVPCFCPSTIENPYFLQDNKSPWEKGLENAKAMIQKSISKKMDDTEFENKKMYISSSSGTLDIPKERDPVLKPTGKNKFNSLRKTEPLKTNPLRHDKTVKEKTSVNKSNCYKSKILNRENYWVDPWMRSKSPRKTGKYQLSSKKDNSYEVDSSSSSSSIKHNAECSQDKKLYRRNSRASHLNIRCSRSRSHSRSFSRSTSRTVSRSWSCSSSCSRSSDSFHSSYRKPIKKLKKIRRKRRSTSIEKWYKSEHQAASASRNSTRSNIISFHRSPGNVSIKTDSDNESWSSMTVSSISCSDTSSDSRSKPHSKLNVRNELPKTLRNTTETTNCHHLPLKREFKGEKSLIRHDDITACKGKTLYKSFGNPSCINNKFTASQQVAFTPLHKMSSKPTLSKESTKNQFSSTTNALLKYQTLINNFVSNKDTGSKLKNPLPKMPLKPSLIEEGTKNQFSSTVNSLLKYKTLTNSFNSNKDTGSKLKKHVANLVPTSPSSESPCAPDSNKFGCQPKQTITLNLQPKSRKLMKLSEIPQKKQDTPETSHNTENVALNKRKLLLKQLKLIEDAIAKKRGCQS